MPYMPCINIESFHLLSGVEINQIRYFQKCTKKMIYDEKKSTKHNKNKLFKIFIIKMKDQMIIYIKNFILFRNLEFLLNFFNANAGP